MEKKLKVIKDSKGHNVVVADEVIFKGRRGVNWKEVEEYVRKYIGQFFEIMETKDVVYIDKNFPDEFAGSKDTYKLRGAGAKAKANTAQCIPELLEIATNKRFKQNFKAKHVWKAKYGWYRYDSRIAIPIYDELGKTGHYNLFQIEMIIRHDADGKLYLYDLINIKKETGNPLEV